MCIVCKYFFREKRLTKNEALKALFELVESGNEDELHLQQAYSDIENSDADDRLVASER